jgi:hypothetical protein
LPATSCSIAASRGRYATDASIYEVPAARRARAEVAGRRRAAIALCREEKVPLLPRGAGSSQCGQTVGAALVIDHSKHLNGITAFDRDAMTVDVEPGVVLDALNAWLKPHGVWFPVDVSTSAQATLGGMAGNNSCGSRSIAYGNMVHNVLAIEATLSDGTERASAPKRRWRQRRRGSRSFFPVSSRSASASAARSTATSRRYCAASAATTSTCAARRASARTPTMAASTMRTFWSAAKARSPGRASSR